MNIKERMNISTWMRDRGFDDEDSINMGDLQETLEDYFDYLHKEHGYINKHYVRKEDVKGLMFMYEHQWAESDRERLCETCGEIVVKGSPCTKSKYYTHWLDLDSLIKDKEGE